jgi:hypothetical protein
MQSVVGFSARLHAPPLLAPHRRARRRHPPRLRLHVPLLLPKVTNQSRAPNSPRLPVLNSRSLGATTDWRFSLLFLFVSAATTKGRRRRRGRATLERKCSSASSPTTARRARTPRRRRVLADAQLPLHLRRSAAPSRARVS